MPTGIKRIPLVFVSDTGEKVVYGTVDVLHNSRQVEVVGKLEEGDNGFEIVFTGHTEKNGSELFSTPVSDLSIGDWARGVEARSGLGSESPETPQPDA